MGRVEVNFDDGYGWGTVCDDDWDEYDAKVVCRSLNLEHRFSVPLQRARFGQGIGEIQMDNVQCSGSETSLRYCSHLDRTQHNCGHSEDAGVICWQISISSLFTGYIENTYPAISAPLDGRLLLRNTGTEKFSVCSNSFGIEEARVACYELGYDRNLSVTFDVTGSPTEGEIYNRIVLTCSGTELKLSYCHRAPRSGSCPSNAPAAPGIACNYEKVSKVMVYSTSILGDKLMLKIGHPTDIHCESDYARPRPQISWYFDNNIRSSGVLNSTTVSNAKYKVRSTLTITPQENLHGRTLSCCSEDPIGYRICSTHYNIYVRVIPEIDTLKISYQKNQSSSEWNLTCLSVRSRPEAELQWLINGELLNDSDTFAVMSEVTSLNDYTFESKTVLTVKEGNSIGDGDYLQCQVTVDDYRQMLHVPIIVISDGNELPSYPGEVGSNVGNARTPVGVTIAFTLLGLAVLLLSIAVIYLFHRIRKQDHSLSSTQQPITVGECFDNRTYGVDNGDIHVALESYEQLQLPQNVKTPKVQSQERKQPQRVPNMKERNKEEDLYENTRVQTQNKPTK